MQTLSDREGLETAIGANPLDTLPYLVFADWLEERGDGDAATLYRAAAGLLSPELSPHFKNLHDAARHKARLTFLHHSCSTSVERIGSLLSMANGRRRERTLNLGDIVETVIDALRDADGWQSMGAGTVANAYGYRSFQTVCLAARRSDGKIRVGIMQQNGQKGSSQVSPFGLTKNAKPEAFRAWADNPTFPE